MKPILKITAFALAAGISGTAVAQTELRIGWTTSDGEADPYAVTARSFAEALEETAPGAFTVSFFPNAQPKCNSVSARRDSTEFLSSSVVKAFFTLRFYTDTTDAFEKMAVELAFSSPVLASWVISIH